MLISALSFIIVFTALALAHEIGHFIWARRAGIRILEFGLGFGPRLFALKRGETVYSINLVPILAFVRIAGEGETEEDLNCPESEKYQSKSPLQKFKTLVAGPIMNILLALAIMILTTLTVGIPSGASFEIASVNKDQPAALAGLKAGDKLLAINGHKFKKMEEAVEFIHNNPDKPLVIIVKRLNETLRFTATPKFNAKLKIGLLGFAPKAIYTRANPFLSIYSGLEQTAAMIMATLIIVGKLITGGVSLTDLAGPVGIAQITGKYAESGLVSLLFFTAFLNVNVGVLNLLPIPALDGGQIIFVIIEWLRKKPIDSRLENKINYWGFVLLLALMALISAHDLLRIFRGQ